jgi:hypothetical protein
VKLIFETIGNALLSIAEGLLWIAEGVASIFNPNVFVPVKRKRRRIMTVEEAFERDAERLREDARRAMRL